MPNALRIKYTRHCKLRMAERGIREDMVIKAITSPSLKYYDLISRTNIVFKKIDEKHLLVAYSKEGDEIRVVTTFITDSVHDIVKRKVGAGAWVRIE